MNVFGRMTDIIVFCIVAFLLPALLMVFLTEEVENTTADVKLRNFAENISTKGYVNKEMYESFLFEMNSLGVVVFPEFCVEHPLYAPEYHMRSIEEANDYLTGLFDGPNENHQTPFVSDRPTVTDPGSPTGEMILHNETEASTTTNESSLGHMHTDSCYTGTMHTHTAACATVKEPCPAGCAKHVHSGSSWGGGGCYTNYHSGSSYTCGTAYKVDSVEFLYPYICDECGKRYNSYEIKYQCSNCGESFWVFTGMTSIGYGDDHVCYMNGASATYPHDKYESGYYDCNCGLDTSTYYKDGSVCPTCHGTGHIDKVACTKENGKYYDALGNECSPVCGQVVTNIAPIVGEQSLTMGAQPDRRVLVTFLDGHTEVVEADVSGFNGNSINTLQTITLSYGMYRGNAKAPGLSSCTIRLSVTYPKRTCAYGHTYYLVNGAETQCPYCKSYPEMLTILGAESPFHIRKGTTLSENGVRIKVTYLDGHEQILVSGWMDNLDQEYVGLQTVIIGYLGAYTSLEVNNERRLTGCPVCGFEYELYPDNTDPGCPKCLAAIPEFTGNMLHYTETKSFGQILDELYCGSGIVYFTKGDRLTCKLKRNGSTASNTVLSRLLGSGIGEETISVYNINLRDGKTGYPTE